MAEADVETLEMMDGVQRYCLMGVCLGECGS